jgi:hypothetical protein
MAKKTNGISISARVKRVLSGILAVIATATISTKYPKKLNHQVIGVATTVKMKSRAAMIFGCAGRE